MEKSGWQLWKQRGFRRALRDFGTDFPGFTGSIDQWNTYTSSSMVLPLIFQFLCTLWCVGANLDKLFIFHVASQYIRLKTLALL